MRFSVEIAALTLTRPPARVTGAGSRSNKPAVAGRLGAKSNMRYGYTTEVWSLPAAAFSSRSVGLVKTGPFSTT